MSAARNPGLVSAVDPIRLVSSLFAHRHLIRQFAVRNIEMRHRGSYLGFAWAVLNPLLLLTLYVFVFGFMFGGTYGAVPDETKWDYGLGIFLSLTIFHFIAEVMASAPSIIVGQPNFVKKVVFPLEVLPAASVASAFFHALISLAMVLVGVLVGGRGLSFDALLLPLIFLPALTLALGLAWLIAALGVFFRDVGQLVSVLITALMFASAIFYPVERVQTHAPAAWQFLRFNPLLHLVDMARDVVLWQRAVDPWNLVAVNIAGVIFAVIGFAVFTRLKPAFADVL
ncbi:ABC transporter permease [Opitutales bacterium ASA1]|uniref:ABC transporter permease n=1 Tax=Congregicoccus parvus TaxID=3081749 RepID=UPI002B2D3BDE|nr:ABC transporter permease [Opitutales bacterium ASA1]